MNDTTLENEYEPVKRSNSTIADPLNRDQPIVRDYVLDDYNNQSPKGDAAQTEFAEPVDFKDAFSMPSEDDNLDAPTGTTEPKPKEPAPEQNKSFNPSFDQMDGKKQKKKSLRFAKQITNLICDLAEKGFYWATTKDITDAKLTEYEASGEIDLTLLVELADGQEATIRKFFANQVLLSESESKISVEDREELIECLAEVMLEKGIAPTASQELMLVSAKVFGIMIVKGVTIQKQNSAILAQLRNPEFEAAPTGEPERRQASAAEEIEEVEEVEEVEDETPEFKKRSKRQTPMTFEDLSDLKLESYV